MFRMWAKLYKNNKIIKDHVVSDSGSDSRTRKVFAALTAACLEFDLPEPIWFKSNISEFKRLSGTRFSKDNFIETVPFDYMEIRILEDD